MEVWIVLGLVAIIFLVIAAVYVLAFIFYFLRMIFDKDFRKKQSEEAKARQRSYTPKYKERYPTDKMFKNYYRIGNRRYLYDKDYKGD